MSKIKNKRTLKKTEHISAPVSRTSPPAAQTETYNRLAAAVRTNPQDVSAALALAEYCNSNKLEDRILPALEPLERLYPFSSPEQRCRFDRLLAFAYVRARKFVDAERVINRGIQESPDSLDLYYALSYQKVSLREYEDTITACENFLSIYKSQDTVLPGKYFTRTEGHKSQLLNFMATAYREMSEPDKAIAAFEESIAADPGNHLPYLNLAGLYIQKRRPETAQEVVDRGLKSCHQIQELRMLLDSYKKKTTVSACLIVKDEEKLLEGCLKSIRDWVDEIIVVDTGSTDRTVEIAESFHARIFHQPWEGDFSKARNYSLEQATCDWIFIIDADECVYDEDVPGIIQLLNQREHPFISVNIINVYGENEETVTFLPSERFFRRELNLRYKGIVHNQLDVPQGLRALRTGIRIKHYGYGLEPEKMRQKLARSRALLEQQLKENPDNAFAHFNLAQLLRAGEHGFPRENAPDIIKHASRGVELSDPSRTEQKHIHLMCLDQLAWTYFHTDEYEKAKEYAQRALALKPDYLDPLLAMGHIHCQLKQYNAAIEHYQKYLEVQAAYDPARELTNIILFHVDSRLSAYYALAMIYLARQDTETAKEYYRKTLKLNPGYLEANSHLGRILFDENRYDEAEEYFLKQLELGKRSHEAALGLAAIYLQRQQNDRAEKYYRLALEIKPDDVVALVRLGRLCTWSGREAEAAACLEKAVETAESDTGLKKELAAAYFTIGQYDKAAAVHTELIEGGNGSAESYNDLGNCYFKQGEMDKAEQCYQQALQFSPPLDLAYRNLGLTRARLDRPKEAIMPLEKYLEVSPSDDEVLLILGGLYAKTEDYPSALSTYEKYLKLHPADVSALFNLSECYLHMGHIDSAALGYQRVLQIDPDLHPAQERLRSLPARVNRA